MLGLAADTSCDLRDEAALRRVCNAGPGETFNGQGGRPCDGAAYDQALEARQGATLY
jgi:hypothetical protein